MLQIMRLFDVPYLTIQKFIIHSWYKHCHQVCVKIEMRQGRQQITHALDCYKHQALKTIYLQCIQIEHLTVSVAVFIVKLDRFCCETKNIRHFQVGMIALLDKMSDAARRN